MHTANPRRALKMPARFWSQHREPARFWSQHREASLNWLAIGLLLAAWNAADDGDAAEHRPEPLRAYSHVTVRALARSDASLPRAESSFP